MNKIKSRFFNITTVHIVGILLVFLAAAALLWHGNATSNQAISATAARVYFAGEYRIGNGPWKTIVDGEHIPATQGDVTLRGNFHMMSPDGEYIGLFRGSTPIAFFLNHISLTFYESGKEPYLIDNENPLFGSSACGVDWSAHSFTGGSSDVIEIVVHNPHSYGNETAVDELLDNIAIWAGIDFEKNLMNEGSSQRNMGLAFVIVSFIFLGTALFSTLIHIKNSKLFWSLGCVILFAGAYLTYSADGVSFWSESIVFNTTMLGCSMMFYMLFLLMTIAHFLKSTKKLGLIAISALGAIDVAFFVIPIFSDVRFYDLWIYWVFAQAAVNCILVVCLAKEFGSTKGRERWLCAGAILPLIAFCIDSLMTGLGTWIGGVVSKYVFLLLFAVATVVLIKVVPNSINAIAKAKELETERIVLNAQLTESRVSTMMSQIRPHFIYNTLGSIEQLCKLDPPKAGELVHNFAKYLRGNFGELDNPKPILMSQEMEHVHHYISIENVRFPDMTFSFEMNSDDFAIPALTIQPIVENAIKHGLMRLEKGGTIKVVSYETDTHYCVTVEDDGVGFDTGVLLDDRKHVGIRNIRGRLKAMVDGSLEIESTVGVGTKVLIKIPKEIRE